MEKTSIPVKMISKNNKDTFTGCVLKLSKGVLDKLDVIKGTVSRESLQKYKSAKTHLQQWQATGSGAFS